MGGIDVVHCLCMCVLSVAGEVSVSVSFDISGRSIFSSRTVKRSGRNVARFAPTELTSASVRQTLAKHYEDNPRWQQEL